MSEPRNQPRSGPHARQLETTTALLQRVAVLRDRQAFAALFDLYAPRLKYFMMRKGANGELAEDLVQETMIAVWSKAALFTPERGSVTAWVYTIARNLRIDRLRRDKTSLYTELDDYDPPSADANAEEMLGRFQEDGYVSRALAQIAPEQRELLILSYIDDVSQSEIATRLNLPLGTVKSRMRLAYQHLRNLLESVT
jgi:RNA polymerase sigma-70 factor, ECF subfamily